MSAAENNTILWPNHMQSAVALAFDLDGPTGDAMLDGSLTNNMRYFTEGAYGPWKALPRIIELLERHHFKATFFIPTWIATHWPERCELVLSKGHEVAYHGHRHEVFYECSRAEQLDIMQTSKNIFQTRFGVTPVGFRTPSGDWSDDTAGLLKDFGVIYSSSMRGDDRPYFHLPSGLVEIPARSDLDDYASLAYFENPDYPDGLDHVSPFRTVADNWCAEFSGFHKEGLCWTTILHPKVSGKPGRLSILEKLFSTIQTHDNAWVASCEDVARWWLKTYQPGKGNHHG